MYKKITAVIAIFIFTLSAFSQRITTRDQYIDTYSSLAVREMLRSGVPASITLAQGCLESGNGNSRLSVKSNNHFGIKCKSSWKGKRVYHDDDRKNECFRHYRTVEASYIDHSNFLMSNPRYGSLFELDITDYKGWAKGLKKAGYATASHYATELIRIVEENKLYLYDQGLDKAELARIEKNGIHDPKKSNGQLINPYKKRKTVLRNGLKTIAVKSGDSFEKIAQEFGLKAWEIYAYNDYSSKRKLQVNEIIYIQPKQKRADKKHQTHRFKKGESMHFIAQRYGVKLKPLFRRNRMKQGQLPVAGSVIYLRTKKPRD